MQKKARISERNNAQVRVVLFLANTSINCS